MKCPHCGDGLARVSKGGEPMIRNAGLLFKAEGMAVICPSCKGDVPVGGDVANQMRRRLVIVRRDGLSTNPHSPKKVVTAL